MLIATWEDNVRGNIFLARGLWIILSILMKLLLVATSVWTSNVWLVPTPLRLVNVTAIPAAALLVLIATLILSLVILIGNTSGGNILVFPIPGTEVVTIPIDVFPTPE